MAGKQVSFKVTKTVQKPTVVKFHTKDGKLVSFKAIETVKQKVPVKFTTKTKR